MRSLFVIRRQRQRWHVLPARAVRCFVIAFLVVLGAFFLLDRLVLPVLERRGLTSGDDWARHNAVVVDEHQRSDRTVGFPEPVPPRVPAGVRSWEGHLVEAAKIPETRRILVMGDSFVWGSAYLSLNHCWWRQLGQMLEPYGVEVIAIGRPGASTRDQLQWARHFAPDFEPDLIIWGYVTNDPDEGRVRQISTSQQSIPRLDRVRNIARKIWPRMMSKFDSLRSAKLSAMYTGEKYGYEYSEWELKLVEPENLKIYAETVSEIKRFMDVRHYRGFMMTLPNFPSKARFDPRNRPAVDVWNAAGIPAFDTTDEFVKRYGETPLTGTASIQWGINPADGHPGPRACRFLAEQAAAVIRRDYPELLGPRSTEPVTIRVNDWVPSLETPSSQQFEETRTIWKMECPNDESRWPTMPLGTPTPLFSFENPVLFKSIELKGSGLTKARIWLTFLEAEEHYDDGTPHDLGERQGQDLSWDIPPELSGRPVGVVRYRAQFAGGNRELVWSFHSGTLVQAGASVQE